MTDKTLKPFKTTEEQINILKERGLLFESPETAYKASSLEIDGSTTAAIRKTINEQLNAQ